MTFAHRYAGKKPDAGTYFLCMIVGLLLGYIFLQMPGDNRPIGREEAICLSGTILECDVNRRQGDIHSIGLVLADQERYFVHDVCASQTLADALAGLPDDAVVTLLVHPDSHNILDIRTEDGILLGFDRSVELLADNANGFGILGLVLIAIAVFCGIKYIMLEIRLYRT